MGVPLESNQCGIETGLYLALPCGDDELESNQCGIETGVLQCAGDNEARLNRTNVELKPEAHRQAAADREA